VTARRLSADYELVILVYVRSTDSSTAELELRINWVAQVAVETDGEVQNRWPERGRKRERRKVETEPERGSSETAQFGTSRRRFKGRFYEGVFLLFGWWRIARGLGHAAIVSSCLESHSTEARRQLHTIRCRRWLRNRSGKREPC